MVAGLCIVRSTTKSRSHGDCLRLAANSAGFAGLCPLNRVEVLELAAANGRIRPKVSVGRFQPPER